MNFLVICGNENISRPKRDASRGNQDETSEQMHEITDRRLFTQKDPRNNTT